MDSAYDSGMDKMCNDIMTNKQFWYLSDNDDSYMYIEFLVFWIYQYAKMFVTLAHSYTKFFKEHPGCVVGIFHHTNILGEIEFI